MKKKSLRKVIRKYMCCFFGLEDNTYIHFPRPHTRAMEGFQAPAHVVGWVTRSGQYRANRGYTNLFAAHRTNVRLFGDRWQRTKDMAVEKAREQKQNAATK
eukprot:PhM_4_TR2760/c0_g1_i1/m.89252